LGVFFVCAAMHRPVWTTDLNWQINSVKHKEDLFRRLLES